MEVVQEVLKHGSANGVRTAIRADKKSYSLVQLIAASLDVHNILCSKNVPQLLLCSAYSFKIAPLVIRILNPDFVPVSQMIFLLAHFPMSGTLGAL
jgi:hypothetical protein